MPNPFTFYNPAATAREHQSNANYWTYAKMDAIETMQEWEKNHPRQTVPCEIQANVHTCRWVEKEMIYKAQQARIAADLNRQLSTRQRYSACTSP